MRRILILLTALLMPIALDAQWQEVRDIDINITLLSQGGAVVRETWDINTGDDITEWYLVRQNLGDIEIRSFKVMDEKGTTFIDEGEWDVDRTLEEKEGRSGIVYKEDGVELCWGVAPLGDHVYRVLYGMTNAVKSLSDYDMLHLQVVSPGLSSPPEHVKVTIEAKQHPLDTSNTRAWGFGFGGRTSFVDGKVVLESTEPLKKEHSVIVLLRLDKGFFQSPSVQERDFQDALDIAMAGADFGDKKDKESDPIASGIAWFFTILIMFFIVRKPAMAMLGKKTRKEIKRVAGVSKLKDLPWYRDVPLEGHLGAASRVLEELGFTGKKNNLAQAYILRLVHTGYLKASRELEGPVKLSFTDKDVEGLDPSLKRFHGLLREAAGNDNILEGNEFSSWARTNDEEVYAWHCSSSILSVDYLEEKGWYTGSKYTPQGQAEARNLVGLRKFLDEFTLVRERETVEAVLWKEYLVYAALFGLAEKVGQQLKDINPQLFAQTFPYEPDTLTSLLLASADLASSFSTAILTGSPSTSSDDSGSSGFGGSTSYGGGGGFSGGGSGGGSR